MKIQILVLLFLFMAVPFANAETVRGPNGKYANPTLLSAVATTGASSGIEIRYELEKTFDIFGTFVGTVKIQGSNDNVNWVDVVTTTVPGMWANNDRFMFVRANVTVYSSGAITVIMGR